MYTLEAKLNEYIAKANYTGIGIELLNKGKSYSLLIEGEETKEYKSIEELVQNEILSDVFSTIEEAQESI